MWLDELTIFLSIWNEWDDEWQNNVTQCLHKKEVKKYISMDQLVV